MTPAETKEKVVKTAHEIFDQLWEGPREYASAGCMYWAAATVKALREHGFPKPIIQAGSMSWPFVNEDQDDGVRITHLSYNWHYTRRQLPMLVVQALDSGKLPEIHCWAAMPAEPNAEDYKPFQKEPRQVRGELIDLSTGLFPRQLKLILPNKIWIGKKPPDYLWCESHEIPERVVYEPSFDAIQFAMKVLFTTRPETRNWFF
jgi:hypothetical protein